MHATKAASEEGIVPGGGVALVRAQRKLADLKLTGERGQGVAIVQRAIEVPLRQIAANAGTEPSIVINKVKEGKDDFGFNAGNDKFENLLKAGVIDSTKVVRIALQNAASVAGMMLTMEAAIADKPEKKHPVGGGHGHGHSHGDDFDDEY
jgi:chaperonin GroEL